MAAAGVALAVAVAAAGCRVAGGASGSEPGGRIEPERHATAAFEAEVAEYVALHRELESKLPKLADEASPEEIDRNQRSLGAMLREARSDARPGEFFTPEMQAWLGRVLARLTAGTDGKNLVGEIMDENPGVPALEVGERYPDAVPLSTMPAELLGRLPPLEEDLEYRFVGRRLVLLDTHGHVIVDFTDELLPD
jgi:hypothetical protein